MGPDIFQFAAFTPLKITFSQQFIELKERILLRGYRERPGYGEKSIRDFP